MKFGVLTEVVGLIDSGLCNDILVSIFFKPVRINTLVQQFQAHFYDLCLRLGHNCLRKYNLLCSFHHKIFCLIR